MGDQVPLKYYSSFLVLWRWTSVICSLAGALTYGLCWALGHPISPPPTIGIVLGAGLLFAVAIVFFPVYVLADGVRCYNFWGLYRTIEWGKVASIRRINLLGLRYLRVVSSGGSVIWLPMYLSDMGWFKAVVRERAGVDNLLVLALERE